MTEDFPVERVALTEFARFDDFEGYTVDFKRDETLPPDAVTVLLGHEAGFILRLQETAMQLYGYGEAGQTKRVLELGCGAGAFLVATLAASHELPIELWGLDIDPIVLGYAETNLDRAADKAAADHPDKLIEMRMIEADWFDKDFWANCGEFDYIYFNPPYLKAGEPIESGFENVPARHLYSGDPMKLYADVLPFCLGHLNVGGVLVMRSSSRAHRLGLDDERIKAVYKEINSPIGVLNGWQMFAEDKSGQYNMYWRAPDDWTFLHPPYYTPRTLVMNQKGFDIGEVN